jgi:predicted component of type VI protein secretion system
MANLRLIPGSGPPIEVAKDEALVGRDPGCDVVVADGSVSRRHAKIQRRGEGFTVVDQGSANGTFIDSQRVAEVTLRTGQELRFGAIAFTVEIEGMADAGATVAGVPSLSEATIVSTSPLMPVPPLPKPPAPAPAPLASPPPPPPGIPKPPTPPPPIPKPPPPPSAAQAKERFKPPPPPGGPVPPPPVPQMSGDPAPAKKGKGPVFWVFAGCCGCLLLCLILAALGFGGIFFMTQAPASAVREQLKALKANDPAACGYLASSASLDCDQLKALAQQHPGLGANKDSTFMKRSVQNDKATLNGVVVSETGKEEPVTFTLTKEGADWKVVDIHFEGPTVD